MKLLPFPPPPHVRKGDIKIQEHNSEQERGKSTEIGLIDLLNPL